MAITRIKPISNGQKQLKPSHKRAILREFFELMVLTGYDIEPYVGRSLNYFDYDTIREVILDLKKEYKDQGGIEEEE
jgi:hypothetical protein